MQVPAATEFLEPLACAYLNDLITWGSIGARTAASQIHRQLASGLSLPLGFKNGTDGNLDLCINGLIAARAPHSHMGLNEQGQPSVIHTIGNPHTHIVLRGSESQPNYTDLHILDALNRLQRMHLPPRLMIDCSHDNCYKNHDLQTGVFQNIIKQSLDGQQGIFGLMLESHLQAGSQQIPSDKEKLAYGVSITDPCLDWQTTEELILNAHNQLMRRKMQVSVPSSNAHQTRKS
jgi:3-deoxy-7-phosphoheptulonate synthase